MTIQQLTAGKEILDKISKHEEQINMLREFMKAYSEYPSEESLGLYVSMEYPRKEYIGHFPVEDIRTFSNNRIAKLEEEIKELEEEIESL